MGKQQYKERTPVTVYEDYAKLEADAKPGSVMFTTRSGVDGTTGMIIRCPGCNEQSALDINYPGSTHRTSWDMKKKVPLTLHPSVHHATDLGGCGWHGWIKEGFWVR